MKAIKGIKSSLGQKHEPSTIARKIFLSYSTEVFKDKEDDEFYIKNEISRKFKIPFSSVEVAGSSKTGLSFYKDKLFTPGESDLDIAVISQELFTFYAEEVHYITNGYSDLSSFEIYNGKSNDKQFKNGLAKGFFNPFLMPICDLKTDWQEFFNKLSNRYIKLFKSINGGIYASEYFFESKQTDCIYQYTSNQKKYDKISGSF